MMKKEDRVQIINVVRDVIFESLKHEEEHFERYKIQAQANLGAWVANFDFSDENDLESKMEDYKRKTKLALKASEESFLVCLKLLLGHHLFQLKVFWLSSLLFLEIVH